MNKTAVEWFDEQLYKLIELKPSQYDKLNKVFQQAKEMEKEQIIDAFLYNGYIGGATEEEAEQYYNETFNQ